MRLVFLLLIFIFFTYLFSGNLSISTGCKFAIGSNSFIVSSFSLTSSSVTSTAACGDGLLQGFYSILYFLRTFLAAFCTLLVFFKSIFSPMSVSVFFSILILLLLLKMQLYCMASKSFVSWYPACFNQSVAALFSLFSCPIFLFFVFFLNFFSYFYSSFHTGSNYFFTLWWSAAYINLICVWYAYIVIRNCQFSNY